jgi:protein-tyrosine phosphatase
MNQILPGTVFEGALWLGDIHSLSHKKQISDSKIKTAICCIHGYKPENLPKDVTLYHFPLHDKEEQDIQQYFRNAYEIIRKGRENGSVLVFCFAGVSRSASIVLSYIMAEHNKDYR